MEGFFGILKREMFYGQENKYDSLDELEQAIRKYKRLQYRENQKQTKRTYSDRISE